MVTDTAEGAGEAGHPQTLRSVWGNRMEKARP